MISTQPAATASTVSLTEDTSSNPPPYVQRCIEELRSIGITVSRHRLYKEVAKAHSPKLRKKRRIGLALDQYEEIMIYKTKLGGVALSLELPSLLGESLHYLEDYLHVKGLFRKSPAVSRLRELEVSIASGRSLGELQPPPHDVAGLVKSFLRSLPDPLFSEQIVSILTQCPSLLHDELRGILLACTLLSPASLHCMQAVLALLAMVAENYTENKMNRNSLAVVIAPTLFYNRHSLKKPLKERAITHNIIRVIETMLNNPEAVALVEMQGTADSDKWKERRRTGSLSDLLKVFPRKTNKLRISSQPYPVVARGAENNPQFVSGVSADNQPVIKSVRGKRPLEKYKPLLTEAKRARLLEQNGAMREVMLRRQIQIKDNKLVRRNAFLQRRGLQNLGAAPDMNINTETAGVNRTTEAFRKVNTTPKIPYPFENIRKNLEFKFVSEDSNPVTIFPIPLNIQSQSQISTTRVPIVDNDNNNNCTNQYKQECSLDSTESIIHADSSEDMMQSRSEESLEKFADSLLSSNSSLRAAETHNFTRQTMTTPEISQFFEKSSYTMPRPSSARRVNRQCEYFQCPENRVHINDKDVILPSSIHEIYISASGCSSTPINILDSPFRVMSSVRGASEDPDPLQTQFGTIPLQRTLRLKDRPRQEVPPSTPLFSEQPKHAHTDIPRRARPYLPTPAPAPTNSCSLSNSEISADTTGLTDSETPASFHRQHAIRKSFRKLLSPSVPSKRDKPDSDKGSFEKKEKSKSSSSLKKNKPQRRWSLRGMFKSPTPPRPVIHTTVISSPIPVKLPFHPIFTDQRAAYKQIPPIVKRPCTNCTPPLLHVDFSSTDLFSAEVTPVCPEWVGSPPSIISSENSDMTSSSEYKLNPHSKEDPLSELLPPLPPQCDATHNTVATPSDLTSEDILRDDSFSDTSFDTSPLALDEESPVVLYPFVEASIFAKPHMGAIKVLPDLPPLAPLKPIKGFSHSATLPRRSKSFREESQIEEIDSETEKLEGDSMDTAKRSCDDILTNPLPDVADCVKLFEAMARPNSEGRRDTNVRASFGGFYMDTNRNQPRLIKRASMREPERN